MQTPRQQSRTLLVFRERLSRLPVATHPALFFNPWLEGYRNYTFGGRAGPNTECSNLFHELAHAAQFGSETFRTRATPTGYRFKVPRVFVCDRYCADPRSSQATLRELDTFAHQLHLMRRTGIKVGDQQFFGYSARVMRFMHDSCFIPGKGDEARAAYCSQQIAEAYARLTAAEVLDKLEAWLDATQRRLARQAKTAPKPRNASAPQSVRFEHLETRYRVDERV